MTFLENAGNAKTRVLAEPCEPVSSISDDSGGASGVTPKTHTLFSKTHPQARPAKNPGGRGQASEIGRAFKHTTSRTEGVCVCYFAIMG